MSEENGQGTGLLDRLVDRVAKLVDAAGFNGTRLRWRWNKRRRELSEEGLRSAMAWRSTRGRHKMCPSCRALVPRGARTCPECGSGLAGVRAPGLGRLLSNVFPGATTATSLLLLVNGALFLLMLLASARAGSGTLGFLMRFSGETMVRFGSGFSPLTIEYGQWWRIVTPIFLHGGLLHFFFNSYVLLQVGPLTEQEYGTERFWVVYLLSGIAGSAASQLLRPVHTVGASGAIFGLIGLLLAYGIRRGGVAGRSLRSNLSTWVFYMFVFSLLPGIDFLNHLGGFAAGFALGWVVPPGPFRDRARGKGWEALALGGVLLVLYCFYRVAASG